MALYNEWTDITCPETCEDTFLFPELPEDPDCEVLEHPSEISDVFFTPCGADNPFDFTVSPIELVAGAIDNTNTDNTKSKHLTGIGSIGDHEVTTRVRPRFKLAIVKRRYTLEFITSVADPVKYTFCRYLQCNPSNFVFQYATVGGDLFGDTGGIIPSSIDVFFPLASGEEAVQEARIVIVYDTANGNPRRGDNPLYATSACVGGGDIIEGV